MRHLTIFSSNLFTKVSHSKERAEKVCLNCGAALTDRYCQKCGQENVAPQQSFWHLIVHFFNDFTHFDGKFFSTIKYLLKKPGFLSAEYKDGKRASYLDPVRMYIFTSALFFLLVFSFSFDEAQKGGLKASITLENEDGSAKPVDKNNLVDILYSADTGFSPQTSAQYDSLEQTLPLEERDGWVRRYLEHKRLDNADYIKNNTYTFMATFANALLNSISKIVILSLPVFAFILYLLNWRRRKSYYYVSHIIFSIHVYCTSFICIMLFLLVYKITGPVRVLSPALLFATVAGVILYLFFAMRRFYQKNVFKTIVDFIVVSIISCAALCGLAVISFVRAVAGALPN